MNKVIVLMHRYIDGAYEKDNILGVATTEDSAIRMIRSYFNDRYESQYDKIGEIIKEKHFNDKVKYSTIPKNDIYKKYKVELKKGHITAYEYVNYCEVNLDSTRIVIDYSTVI